jgi:hypothetical protein
MVCSPRCGRRNRLAQHLGTGCDAQFGASLKRGGIDPRVNMNMAHLHNPGWW